MATGKAGCRAAGGGGAESSSLAAAAAVFCCVSLERQSHARAMRARPRRAARAHTSSQRSPLRAYEGALPHLERTMRHNKDHTGIACSIGITSRTQRADLRRQTRVLRRNVSAPGVFVLPPPPLRSQSDAHRRQSWRRGADRRGGGAKWTFERMKSARADVAEE
jgi:hypothetical protein